MYSALPQMNNFRWVEIKYSSPVCYGHFNIQWKRSSKHTFPFIKNNLDIRLVKQISPYRQKPVLLMCSQNVPTRSNVGQSYIELSRMNPSALFWYSFHNTEPGGRREEGGIALLKRFLYLQRNSHMKFSFTANNSLHSISDYLYNLNYSVIRKQVCDFRPYY